MKKIKFAKVKEFFKGKGFIGALCLSVAAIGIATYVAYDRTLRDITSQPSFTPTTEQQVANDVSGVPKEEETSAPAESADAPAATEKPDSSTDSQPDEDEKANNFVSGEPERMMPVQGEILNPYSNGELVKSETLGVWKTHDGIDIACEEGTDIRAAAAGKVIQIRDDPLWGVCAVIDHYDGYQGYYFGLDKALEIKEQQEVDAGDIIGRTAPFDCEAKLAPHLHFGVKLSEKWIDPAEFIGEE